MTENDKEIQELRREAEELKHLHQLDIAEIAYLRRQIDFLMEGTVVSNRPQVD